MAPLAPRLVLLVLLFAASSPLAQEAAPFEASGEVRFRVQGGMATSASYNAGRVVGPVVNVTRREDGTWAGDLLGSNLDLHATPAKESERKVSGSSFTLVQRATKNGHEIEGLINGVRFRANVERKRVRARFGDCSLDVERKGGVYRGDVGCLVPNQSLPQTGRAVLDLMGDAVEQAPFPQLGLALMACLPLSS